MTIGMVQSPLDAADNTKGALLDGFPRTPAQAQALDTMFQGSGAAIKVVPYISVPENVLIERLSGRWTCRAAGHVFHSIYNPPQKHGVCDVDGSELYQTGR